MSVPLPPDEASRLQVLAPYKALGLAPEVAYDRITGLAASIFRVPMALVTLLDRDCQYFKSHHGTDLSGSTREAAVCSHTILSPVGEVFVVPDLTLDARFADNPLVVGAPGIRFYAGAPLRTAAGQPLGSLCLIDTVPRADLTGAERKLLTDLAAMVMETFELRLSIEARRQAQRQLEDSHALLRTAKDVAEEADAAKSEFLSRMSHELRTPLNAILGFSQLLELGTLTGRQAESIGHILRAGRHLLNLIDEVLAISRIEAGRMHLSLEPVCLGEIIDECLSLVGRLARDRDVRCEKDCLIDAAGCEIHVQADRQRLRQVLLNLLSNAIKYNREGGEVRLSCRDVPALPGASTHDAGNGETPAGRVRIEVSDQGPGLTPEDIGRLFVPFERLGAEQTATEGTGLGLALSKSLVAAMNGSIGVDSVPGEGSTFWIELPLAAHPLERLARGGLALPGLGAEPACAGTVLYIEDNLSNLRLIECLLGVGTRLELLSAQQGMLGVEMARARLPDLILLDLHLPDIPGWEVLARLRADPATRDIPAIVISADATPHQIERLQAAGAQEYLTKPINVRELLRVLRKHLRPAGTLAAV